MYNNNDSLYFDSDFDMILCKSVITLVTSGVFTASISVEKCENMPFVLCLECPCEKWEEPHSSAL